MTFTTHIIGLRYSFDGRLRRRQPQRTSSRRSGGGHQGENFRLPAGWSMVTPWRGTRQSRRKRREGILSTVPRVSAIQADPPYSLWKSPGRISAVYATDASLSLSRAREDVRAGRNRSVRAEPKILLQPLLESGARTGVPERLHCLSTIPAYEPTSSLYPQQPDIPRFSPVPRSVSIAEGIVEHRMTAP